MTISYINLKFYFLILTIPNVIAVIVTGWIHFAWHLLHIFLQKCWVFHSFTVKEKIYNLFFFIITPSVKFKSSSNKSISWLNDIYILKMDFRRKRERWIFNFRDYIHHSKLKNSHLTWPGNKSLFKFLLMKLFAFFIFKLHIKLTQTRESFRVKQIFLHRFKKWFYQSVVLTSKTTIIPHIIIHDMWCCTFWKQVLHKYRFSI